MTAEAKKIFEQALALPDEERAALMEALRGTVARSRNTFGRSASMVLAVSVAVVVSACNSARLTSKRPAQDQCVPALCPVGEVRAKGRVVAARMAGEEVSLLVDGFRDAWVVNGAGERDRIELPNEGPVHMENGDVSWSLPTWSVYKGAATGDGFVLLLLGRLSVL